MSALAIALLVTLPPLGLCGVTAIGVVIAATRLNHRREDQS